MAEVRVPRTTTRSARRWTAATGIVLVVAVGASLWRYPEELTRGLPFLLLAVAALAVVLSVRVHVDPERGTVRRSRWLFPSRTVRLAEADAVGLTDNRNGGLLLGVRQGRRSIYVPIMVTGLYGAATQEPSFVRELATMLERHAPQAADVPKALRAHAEHVDAGGAVTASPLAGGVSNTVMKVAGAGGAGAAGGGLGRFFG